MLDGRNARSYYLAESFSLRRAKQLLTSPNLQANVIFIGSISYRQKGHFLVRFELLSANQDSVFCWVIGTDENEGSREAAELLGHGNLYTSREEMF